MCNLVQNGDGEIIVQKSPSACTCMLRDLKDCQRSLFEELPNNDVVQLFAGICIVTMELAS
jgi:hypothetical protein